MGRGRAKSPAPRIFCETQGRRVPSIDCGLFQGGRKQEAVNRPPAERRVNRLDAVSSPTPTRSHRAVAAVGTARLHGAVYATPATIELTELVLEDSARIQVRRRAHETRKNERAGLPPVAPLLHSGTG